MSVLFLLVILGVVVAIGFLLAFVWSVRNGQYDDMTSPAVRILFDDTHPVDSQSDQIIHQKIKRKHHLRVIH